MYIINLAFSDLTVCFVSMPFTMMRLINHSTWNYGDALCRTTSLLEGVNLLVSSGTASAIATDRLCLVRRKTARRDDLKVSFKPLKMRAINIESRGKQTEVNF